MGRSNGWYRSYWHIAWSIQWWHWTTRSVGRNGGWEKNQGIRHKWNSLHNICNHGIKVTSHNFKMKTEKKQIEIEANWLLEVNCRRLEADRFFTSDYNEEVYTKKGLEWINTTESLKDVLNRHYPEMTDTWMNSTSAFSVWDASPEPRNHVPLYFRVPK